MSQRGLALPFVILIGLVLLVFTAMGIERFVFSDRHLNPPKIGKTENGEECLPNAEPVFKAEFIDRSKILYINPLGNTQADFIGRSHIVLKEGAEVPVYNPTDATLEEVIKKDGKYGLLFRVSCEVTYLFDQLDKVSALAPKTLIKKGELLGYVKSVAQGRAFEFILMNRSKPVAHINSKRWEDKQNLYAQCPYEYFDTRNDNNLRRNYIAYTLVHNENIIQKEWTKEQGVSFIPCGNVSHDIKGTISGGWFKGESSDIKGDHLSVNKYLSTVQVSIRKDGQLVEALADYSPDILVTDVKTGSFACYHDANQNKWAFVKLISENQLSVAKGSGNCPATFPENAQTWKR